MEGQRKGPRLSLDPGPRRPVMEVTKDETLVKRRCHDCGDTFTGEHLGSGSTPLCPGGCRNPYLSCPACGDIFRPEQPPDDGQKVYEVHGCERGKVRLRLDNPTCRHCGAPTEGVGSPCGCPGDTAKRKADADAEAARQDAERHKQELRDKERAARLKASMSLVDLPGLRKVAQRDRTDAELLDRERAVKDRELSRRERRQDGYDADGGQVEDTGEPLSAFEMPMDGSDLDLAPTAMLQRRDGATLLYDGKLNFLFGTPGSGKSWLALYAIHEALLRGKRAIYWDHEDTPSTLKRRSALIGLDLADFWSEGQFKYLRPGLDGSTLAMAEAMTWIAGGDGPTLVVIDSAESAGCPSDGADVAPWLAKIVLPFLEAGATVLVLDHVPKRKEGRPLGPIGSQHKLARVDGAALYVSGVPWTQKTDGHLTLYNHKDRHGQLPAPIGKAVARLVGTHERDTLYLSIVAPETEDNLEEAYIPTLRALVSAGPDGVHGQKAMRDLVVGRNNQKDKAISDLVELDFVLKTPGKKVHYSITALGLEELGASDDEG